MNYFTVERLRNIHIILLLILTVLVMFFSTIYGDDSNFLKFFSLIAKVGIGLWWVGVFILNGLSNKTESGMTYVVTIYNSLIKKNSSFLIFTDVLFFVLIVGLAVFMIFNHVVEFKTANKTSVNVYLSKATINPHESSYVELGTATPDKPLRVTLSLGKKRFFFKSEADSSKQDAKIIHLSPFNTGRTYTYTINIR